MSDDPHHDGRRNRRRFLKATAGAASAAIAVPALSGSGVAHFEEELEIDVVPNSEENRVSADSNGYVRVAVLWTDEFDPTDEPVRYRFGAPDVVSEGGGARPARGGHVRDVDGDGDDDLVLRFPTDETGFDSDDEEGRLEWENDESGEHGLSGTDDVTVVASSR